MFDLYGKTRNTTTPDSAYQGETLWAKVEGVEHTHSHSHLHSQARSGGADAVRGTEDAVAEGQEQPEHRFLGFVHALFTKKAA